MAIQQVNSRAALRASIGLSVKTPIGGVMKFARAVVAHFKGRHGRLLAVVGNVLDDGESRTTVGAVNKRIAIAPIRWIEKLGETIVAGGCIRGDQHTSLLFILTADDIESGLTFQRHDPAINVFDPRQRRRLFPKMCEEIPQAQRPPLKLDGPSRSFLKNKPRQAVLHRESIDERPKADPLDHSFNRNMTPFVHRVPDPPGSGISASGSTW